MKVDLRITGTIGDEPAGSPEKKKEEPMNGRKTVADMVQMAGKHGNKITGGALVLALVAGYQFYADLKEDFEKTKKELCAQVEKEMKQSLDKARIDFDAEMSRLIAEKETEMETKLATIKFETSLALEKTAKAISASTAPAKKDMVKSVFDAPPLSKGEMKKKVEELELPGKVKEKLKEDINTGKFDAQQLIPAN